MEISKLIGLDSARDELIRLVEEKQEPKIVLQGADGRGKTTLLDGLSQYFSLKGYCCLHLYGDASKVKELFYPFKQFVERKQKIHSKSVSAFKESVGSIPFVGETIKVLIGDYDFKSKRNRKTIEEIHPFKEHLDFSTHLVSLQRKYPRLLIICDDFDLFDEATIRYITAIDQGFRSISKKPNIQFIFAVKSLGFEATILGGFHVVQLPPLNSVQVQMLIETWSGKLVSGQDLDLIESCSGSHLQLLKMIALHIKESGSIGYHYSTRDFYKSIIDTRLRRLKDQYEHIKNLFTAVFTSGKRTTVLELVCLLGEEDAVQDLIKKAVQLDLLEFKDNYLHFSHPIVEDYVQELQKPKLSFLNQLTICLKKISPSDYKRRAIIQNLAQHFEDSDILWSLAAIAKMREGLFAEVVTLISNIKSIELGVLLHDALTQFEKCYRLSFTGDLDETLLEVEKIPNALPKELIAEKVYLKAELLLKRIANLPKRDALQLIAQWEDIKEEEPEIWYRLIQLKIILAAELGQHDLALQAEGSIIKYFSARLTFDPIARLILQRLNLFSEVLYTPEIAHRKLIQAELYFTNEIANEQFLRIIDLYIVRCNLSSNCILIDDKTKAVEFAKSALDIIEEYKEIKFPYPDVPLSNLCLAMWWMDSNNLQDVLRTYSQIWATSSSEENKMLIDINYAGFLYLNGQYKEALNVLFNATYIPDNVNDDAYYYYYYWSNYVLLEFINGDKSVAKVKAGELKAAAQVISPFLSKYYLRHWQLMQEVFALDSINSIDDIKSYISGVADVFSSRLWERYKYGYLLTDLQIWTSS